MKDKIYENPLRDVFVDKESRCNDSIPILFERSCLKLPKNNFLGRITKSESLEFFTYGEILEKTKILTGFITSITEERELVGLMAQNSVEWVVTDQSILRSNCVTVPIYTTFGNDSLTHVFGETGLKTLFLSVADVYICFEVLLASKIERIVFITKNFEEQKDFLQNFALIAAFQEKFEIFWENQIYAEKNNFENYARRFPGKEDVATICYTSGTTGTPKGVVLTHRNILASIFAYGVSLEGGQNVEFNTSDVYLSFLPLSHIFERVIFLTMASFNAAVIFFRGDRKLIQKDFEISRPTFIAGVPRVFENMRAKIIQEVNRSFLKKIIFKICYFWKKKNVKKNKFRNMLLDFLVFRRVKGKFGGRIRAVLSGSAPLDAELHYFLECVFSCPVFQGYGMTETSACVLCADLGAKAAGTVGKPYSSNSVKLKERRCGNLEILVKGANIFKEYYKNEDLTRKSFEDGYFKTGDYAREENGVFQIIGRSKNTFKNPQGEFIVPEKIEQLYKEVFDDIYVTGQSYVPFLVAIIVDKTNKSEQEIGKILSEHSASLRAKNKIAGFEVPRKFVLVNKGFMESGFVTPTTLKVIRQEVEKKFENDIKKMLEVEKYEDL